MAPRYASAPDEEFLGLVAQTAADLRQVDLAPIERVVGVEDRRRVSQLVVADLSRRNSDVGQPSSFRCRIYLADLVPGMRRSAAARPWIDWRPPSA